MTRQNLLIVESPAKAKTISKYLGPGFRIMASVGHVKDLPPNRLGVDLAQGFVPEYVIIKGKEKIIRDLKAAAKAADTIYLAPDPDREGEAIAWHIAGELNGGGDRFKRVLFNELTQRAIKAAVASPEELNKDKFEAQQARRILDRLVGYQLSPLLWSRVKRGLSAGRVQSVALRMICDREREIQVFEPREYWSLTARLKAVDPPEFRARLSEYEGEKIELKSEDETLRILEEIKNAPFTVGKVARKRKKRYPPPPFITSLLQQEAYKKLGFSAKKTMSIAQALYEGVELGEKGQIGLITYMRTDSFRVSQEALTEARALIEKNWGRDFLPDRPNAYKSRKGAQEAHEAIRPANVEIQPAQTAPYLSRDQLVLYSLIWKRFIASQMTPALYDETQADIEAAKAVFRASGSVMVFAGFTSLYEEAAQEGDAEKGAESPLPPLKKDQGLTLLSLDPAQHFTQPPARYTEATLIKALEKNGIGRPSTYAAILSNINQREYVSAVKGRFQPTELGFLVSDLLIANFPDIMDMAFTARMEKRLDGIERGEVAWTKVLEQFYGSFNRDLEKAKSSMKGEVLTELKCPDCGSNLSIRSGRNGLFLSCSAYPKCSFTSNYVRDEKGRPALVEKRPFAEQKGEPTGKICRDCGAKMLLKTGRNGQRFLACERYPSCTYTEAPGTGVSCPEEGCGGEIKERSSKKGTRFYGCSNYPECHFVMWDEPYGGACPLCGTKVMTIRRKKGSTPKIQCRKKGCGYNASLPEEPLPAEKS